MDVFHFFKNCANATKTGKASLSKRIMIIGADLQTSTMEIFATVLAMHLVIISTSGWALEAVLLIIHFLTGKVPGF